jgi:hypothetical protein
LILFTVSGRLFSKDLFFVSAKSQTFPSGRAKTISPSIGSEVGIGFGIQVPEGLAKSLSFEWLGKRTTNHPPVITINW